MGIKRVVFPGSFDPLTFGHIDIIRRSLAIFDELVVAVLNNQTKQTLFSVDERIEILKTECAEYGERVQVSSFSGLLVDFVRSIDTRVIVRGLRAVSDYDYEVQMALMNRSLSREIETFFLVTSEENSYISSTLVKQVARLGGNVERYVPNSVQIALKKKLN